MTVTLAVDTATAQVGVALSTGDGVVGQLALRAGRRHGETLAPAIQALCRLAGIDLAALDLVAVDIGPGLFTGLRVGVATAKALGSALGVPIAACSSLDLLAHPHRRLGRHVASVVDARRGELFWAVYQPAAEAMTAVTEPAVQAPEDVAARLSEWPGLLLTGDGARRYFAGGTLGNFEVAPRDFDHPSAAVLADLAPSRPALPPEQVTPTYLRGADVRIGWDQR
ncbi:MAG: tRNA (adenosine(37)-N6)-threonylcarbamoyltransferase complex dimerization subunit type 1 TsaB [Actinomycetota bacterium]|nr:tRNA (adenosine(37)-N6)-threonylcarbamoyltransferase complex dimerization subunit type 1 TsaB [Actinomycetota bacterium]